MFVYPRDGVGAGAVEVKSVPPVTSVPPVIPVPPVATVLVVTLARAAENR